MTPVRVVLLLALTSSILNASANVGITCLMCKTGLARINAIVQSNPGLMAQMGDTVSQGCDQIPDELQRKACRATLDDHFPLFLQKQWGTSPEDFCKSMRYC
ncbi:unnamed protein product [Angiostrongylus costaricensis]|uniref:Saposin B-type domain-containing protein n=1 Tax=Angiostrongylus costaricensis TaxID=334426 RepID=A0A0R3PNQ8_ANGCS|nr:unnamed protein product [Angiostrongylus costaricensis]